MEKIVWSAWLPLCKCLQRPPPICSSNIVTLYEFGVTLRIGMAGNLDTIVAWRRLQLEIGGLPCRWAPPFGGKRWHPSPSSRVGNFGTRKTLGVLHNKLAPRSIIIEKIKSEDSLWSIAGVKSLITNDVSSLFFLLCQTLLISGRGKDFVSV